MSIWENIPRDKLARAWNNLNWWQRTHHGQGLDPPDILENKRDRRVKVDLAIDSRVIEELIDKPAHDHRLRGEE